jgi:hypothetical protein
MVLRGTVYVGALPTAGSTFATSGTVDWWITAIDGAGVTGTSGHHSLTVAC